MASIREGPNGRTSFWYGWIVLAVVFIVMAAMVGVRNSIGFFFKTVSAEFGWNRAETAGAYSIGMIVQSLCSPLFGTAGERWSLRWMTALGVFCGGAALLIGSGVRGLGQFYLMYGLLNVGFAASTFVPQVQILSNWFVRRRGLAMGISNSGQGFATVLILALPFLIGRIGWRNSYLVLAGFTLLLIFPLAAFLLRDYPSPQAKISETPFPDVSERTPLSRPAGAASAGTRPMPGIFSLPFLLIACTYGAIALVMVGTTVHLVPHATDQGFSAQISAWIFLLWGVSLIGGNLISILSDYTGRSPVYAVGTISGIGGCILLSSFIRGMPQVFFYAGTALSGLSLGLIRPTASALLSDHFAGPGFGRLNGSVMTIFGLCGALGAFLTGYLFDLTGSYRSAFLLLAAVHLAGAAGAVSLDRLRPRQAAGQVHTS